MDAFYKVANLLNEATIPDDGIVSRTLFQDESVKAVFFGFSTGQELSEHTASMPAIMHFLEGEARITVAEHESDAGSGTWVHMKANVAHSIVARTPVKMLLLLLKPHKVVSGGAAA